MARYTVKQLARLSGVSVRALHHYDAIGLLKPAFVGENRYRYYGREELLRLQDILFHRELGVPLDAIGQLLDCGGTDRLAALEAHRAELVARMDRSRRLVRTIDRTIAELKGNRTMKDNELYRGFSAEKQGGYEAELIERFGSGMRERIDQSRVAWEKLDAAGREARMAESDHIGQGLAALMRVGEPPESEAAEKLLSRHRAWVAAMWDRPCPPQAYAGLAELYTSHPDFRAQFEAVEPGFTDWLAGAMNAHAARQRD